jgi:hypothetical protein
VTKKSRESLPTVFVYLTRQSTAERTHFARFRFEELVARRLGFAPLWVRMRTTSPMPIRPGEPPPAVLISMGLGCEPAISNKNAFPWPPVPLPMRTTLEAYELRVHLYQARGLPARSDDGLLDPYVVVSLAGTKAKNRKGYERAAAAGMILTPLRFVSGCLRFLAASSAVLISCSMAAFSTSGLEPMRVKSSPGPMSWIVTCR